MDPKTLASAIEALNATLAALKSAPAVAPAVAPATAPAESIWKRDRTVRWVDAGAGARNDVGARIVDGASDPLGLLDWAAVNPGRPIFPEGFSFKTGKPLPANAVLVPASYRPAASTTAVVPPTAPTAPTSQLRGSLAPSTLADDAARVRAAFPEALEALEALGALHVGRGKHTWRDVLIALEVREPLVRS